MIRAIFFDAGNTLLTPYPDEGTTVARVTDRHGYRITPAQFNAHLPAFAEHYAKAYAHDDSFWSAPKRQMMMWMEGYRLLLDRVGITQNQDALIREIYYAFDDPQAWTLFEGTQKTLATLKERGYKLGVISNWGPGLDTLLAGLGLGPDIFDTVVMSAAVGLYKPQPEIFLEACKRLGVEPQESMHVGDHIGADVEGSRAVGIHPVLVRHSEQTSFDPSSQGEIPDVPVISSVPDILEVVEDAQRDIPRVP